MPLNLYYTMVQKSQKWPKTQIKGGPALSLTRVFWDLSWCETTCDNSRHSALASAASSSISSSTERILGKLKVTPDLAIKEHGLEPSYRKIAI